MRLSFFIRGLIGFIVGGLVALVLAGVTLATIYPMPPDQPNRPNYGPDAMSLLVIVTFFCGGFIGRCGFTTNFVSKLFRPIICAYLVILFLCFFSDASFVEAIKMIGFASVGILASAVISVAAFSWLRSKE
jgi:hypothetical protein